MTNEMFKELLEIIKKNKIKDILMRLYKIK